MTGENRATARPKVRFAPIPLQGVPLIEPGTDLLGLICDLTVREGPALHDDDVVVIAQKIVSKAEGRYVDLATIEPGEQALALSTQVQKDARLVEVILRDPARCFGTDPASLSSSTSSALCSPMRALINRTSIRNVA